MTANKKHTITTLIVCCTRCDAKRFTYDPNQAGTGWSCAKCGEPYPTHNVDILDKVLEEGNPCLTIDHNAGYNADDSMRPEHLR